MENFRISFEKLGDVTPNDTKKRKIRPGYENVNVHMIFDINMDGNFTKKARLVADVHTTATPSPITSLSAVSRENVRIEFLLASLNDLEIFTCDIGNAYLNSKSGEKLWTGAGTDFGTEKGMVRIIARELYGIKRYGAAWRSNIAETLNSLG